MATASRIADVAAADALLAQEKRLLGAPPNWTSSDWGGEHAATWIIGDADEAPIAQLKFTARKINSEIASVNLIWRQRTLWRVDMDYASHPNPHDAGAMGLPAVVAAPHAHSWPFNRAHVLEQEIWDLPYRVPLPSTIRRLGQGLLWLAEEINLRIDPDQRGFEGPTRSDLFDQTRK